MIYAWQQSTWQHILANWHKQPNAWLILGKAYTGKTAFARHFAQTLLCEQPTDTHEFCGVCPSCHLFAQDSHPDFYAISPEVPEDGQMGRKLFQIKIDAIRDILIPLNQSSVRGGWRVVLINPAESLNIQAANALLKILEEPPPSVIFLLVCSRRDALLPTIKSRCRQLVLPAPSVQAARVCAREHHAHELENLDDLLAFHAHSPLFPQQPEHDELRGYLLEVLAQPRLLAILDFAHDFDQRKLPLAHLLDWLNKWLMDLALAQQNMAVVYYPSQESVLRQWAQKTNPATLFRFQAVLNALAPYGYHSLNVKMQTESVLCDYLAFTQNKLN